MRKQARKIHQKSRKNLQNQREVGKFYENQENFMNENQENFMKLLTEKENYAKINNCNPLNQGYKNTIKNSYLFLRISEYTNKGGAF